MAPKNQMSTIDVRDLYQVFLKKNLHLYNYNTGTYLFSLKKKYKKDIRNEFKGSVMAYIREPWCSG